MYYIYIIICTYFSHLFSMALPKNPTELPPDSLRPWVNLVSPVAFVEMMPARETKESARVVLP